MKTNRLFYIIATLLLLMIEILIALFVNDRLIRPYLGDILVVILIYTFIRIWFPEGHPLLPVFIFIFAVSIEFLQYFDLVRRLGLEGNRFLRILIGSVFDLKDILCYAIGCTLLGVYEIMLRRNLLFQHFK